jgi:hypothetical protein
MKRKIRNDLKIYIPQLIIFTLFDDVEDIEGFFVFLCRTSNLIFLIQEFNVFIFYD